ncbi:MAG: DUF1360 domain-containing protein [Gemmatimonadota bacterium]|nr:DUF1360 domain-containing protein [Gemmatimonadota bacterium]
MVEQLKQPRALRQAGSVQEVIAGYNGGDEMPLVPYAGIMGVYTAAFAGLLLAARSSGRRLPERIPTTDLAWLGVATYKLSRLISSDRVTSPLRAPFTEYIEPAGASEVKEQVRGTGIRRAIGDLLTCPYCLGPWVATALGFGLVLTPRTTRLIGGILAAAAVSDALNHATMAIKKREG